MSDFVTAFYQVMQDIKEFLVKKRVGNIQINMFKGGITNWTINETKKGPNKTEDDN